MIKGQLVALDSELHKKQNFEGDVTYKFTSDLTTVPVVVGELPLLSNSYPVVFAKSENGSYGLVAVLSFDSEKNAYVDNEGSWLAEYIPSFIRKYPFVTAVVEDDEEGNKVLCIDSEAPHFKAETGEPLFNDKGEPSEIVNISLRLNEEFELSKTQTEDFCNEMANSNVLEERQENSVFGNLSFFAFKVDAISTLPANKIKEWHENGYLHIVMSIINSGRAWRELQARMEFSENEKKNPSSKSSKA